MCTKSSRNQKNPKNQKTSTDMLKKTMVVAKLPSAPYAQFLDLYIMHFAKTIVFTAYPLIFLDFLDFLDS
jgi:hypothetical protein